MNTPAPAAPAANAAPTPPAAADPKAQGKVPEVPPTPQPTGDGGQPPEAKKYSNQIEAELAARYEADGVKWDEINPKVKAGMISAEMKSREADKRMQLAAKLKKDMDMTNAQVAQLFEALKKDPWSVLANPSLGHDVKKLAEEYVWSMIQEQRMTPEQREALLIKKENAEMKAANERAKKEAEDRERDTLVQQRRAHWEKAIPEAIEKYKLPKTSYTVGRFAHYIKALAQARIPADMEKIANVVREEVAGMQPQFLLPEKFQAEKQEDYEDRVLASVPGDFLKLLRRADLRRLRAKGLKPMPGPKPGQSPVQQQPKKMLMSEWQAQKDQRLGRQ